VIFAAIAREFAALCEKDKVVRPIPLLYDVESFVYLAPKRLGMQITTQKDGLDCLTEFRESLVRRMGDVRAGEAPEDRFRLSGAEAEGVVVSYSRCWSRTGCMRARDFSAERSGIRRYS
jgi:hypothetical protein